MILEPHVPTKWKAIGVLSAILLLIVGIFVWVFAIHVGTVIVEADRGFTLKANGVSSDCSGARCELKLFPNNYDFVAHAEGSYDETFSARVERGRTIEKSLQFRLVPYLEEALSELPKADAAASSASLRRSSEGLMSLFFTPSGGEERLVTTFETLQDPKVRFGGNLLVIIDQGRLFFVDLDSGRKTRRFDESILVSDALVSDRGKRVLLFLNAEGRDQLWIWQVESSEIIPLPWYEEPSLVQWDLFGDHQLLVITDELLAGSESVFDQILSTVPSQGSSGSLTLFLYHIDTGKADEVVVFSEELPMSLDRIQDRYFVALKGGQYRELVVR